MELAEQQSKRLQGVKNETKSKINYYISSMLESRVVLEDSTSVEKFEITVFNKNSSDFVFIDALTEIGNLELYDNPNIEMTLEGIEKNVTIIKPSEFLTFTVVFKYKDGADTTNNVLNNKIGKADCMYDNELGMYQSELNKQFIEGGGKADYFDGGIIDISKKL